MLSQRNMNAVKLFMQLVIISNTGFCRWIPTSDLDVGCQGENDKECKAKLWTLAKISFFLQLSFRTGKISCLLSCAQDNFKLAVV